jgi:hypothetical protein
MPSARSLEPSWRRRHRPQVRRRWSTAPSAATGKSVLIFFAAQQVNAAPIDNGDGTVTFVTTFKGLPEMIKLPNGRVLSRDVGFIGFNDTFDATTGDFLGETISPENGPHPDADSGFTLFCDVIVPALS